MDGYDIEKLKKIRKNNYKRQRPMDETLTILPIESLKSENGHQEAIPIMVLNVWRGRLVEVEDADEHCLNSLLRVCINLAFLKCDS